MANDIPNVPALDTTQTAVASTSLSGLAVSLGKSALPSIATKLAGVVWRAITGKSSVGQELAEINQRLDQINQNLSVLKSKIDKIEIDVQVQETIPALSYIDTSYQVVIGAVQGMQPTADNVYTVYNNLNVLAKQASDILSTSGLANQANQINKDLMGLTIKPGILDTQNDNTLGKLDVYNYYYTMKVTACIYLQAFARALSVATILAEIIEKQNGELKTYDLSGKNGIIAPNEDVPVEKTDYYSKNNLSQLCDDITGYYDDLISKFDAIVPKQTADFISMYFSLENPDDGGSVNLKNQSYVDNWVGWATGFASEVNFEIEFAAVNKGAPELYTFKPWFDTNPATFNFQGEHTFMLFRYDRGAHITLLHDDNSRGFLWMEPTKDVSDAFWSQFRIYPNRSGLGSTSNEGSFYIKADKGGERATSWPFNFSVSKQDISSDRIGVTNPPVLGVVSNADPAHPDQQILILKPS